MPITATCPSCSQLCQIEDQYAGLMVRCPKCGNIIQVARPEVAGAPVPPPPASPMPPPITPGAPPGPAGPGFMEIIQQSAASFGLNALELKLLYAGVGCLAAMILFTFFPWVSLFGLHSVLGIQLWYGIVNFLFTSGAMAFVIVTLVVLKRKDTFEICLWVAAGWSALAALWRLFEVAQFGGLSSLGLYLTLLASLGAAGAFGFIIFQRLVKK